MEPDVPHPFQSSIVESETERVISPELGRAAIPHPDRGLSDLICVQAMAYKRSITSSDDDSAGPKFSKANSDSSSSVQSGCSVKHEGLYDYIGPSRRYRRPESPSPSPTPVESSEEDKENIHPALQAVDQRGDSEEEEEFDRYPTHLEPPLPIEISSDSSLQSVIRRIGAPAESSYSGPDGFGAGSSVAAMLQEHLNTTHTRIEELEAESFHRLYAHGEVVAENVELADRVAALSTAFVMMGMGSDAADRLNATLWLAVGVLVVIVAALLVRGWM